MKTFRPVIRIQILVPSVIGSGTSGQLSRFCLYCLPSGKRAARENKGKANYILHGWQDGQGSSVRPVYFGSQLEGAGTSQAITVVGAWGSWSHDTHCQRQREECWGLAHFLLSYSRTPPHAGATHLEGGCSSPN